MTEPLFEALTPLGFSVRCTRNYWEFISSQKHPTLRGREDEIQNALEDRDELRRSRRDINVYLFYRGESRRWICVVTRRRRFLHRLNIFPSHSGIGLIFQRSIFRRRNFSSSLLCNPCNFRRQSFPMMEYVRYARI